MKKFKYTYEKKDKQNNGPSLLQPFFFFFSFLGLLLQHVEVPGLGVELDLQL